jgi:hypothetical protein
MITIWEKAGDLADRRCARVQRAVIGRLRALAAIPPAITQQAAAAPLEAVRTQADDPRLRGAVPGSEGGLEAPRWVLGARVWPPSTATRRRPRRRYRSGPWSASRCDSATSDGSRLRRPRRPPPATRTSERSIATIARRTAVPVNLRSGVDASRLSGVGGANRAVNRCSRLRERGHTLLPG